jgi:sulfatase modifying factor 1
MLRGALIWGLAVACVAAGPVCAGGAPDGMVVVPAGPYTPFQRDKSAHSAEPALAAPSRVAVFRLDFEPVTNARFLAFVQAHPEWRKSKVKPILADERYLKRWLSDLDPPVGASYEPVTNVSWFAAQAYCKALAIRLPTTEQWEYALADSGRGANAVRKRSLEWFAEPNGAHPPAITGSRNGYGVSDLVGLVWEWTLDFDAYAATVESRDPNDKDSGQFCGGAAAGVADATDYPAFMRYAMRASLKAAYTANNLGFRCAGGPS